MKTYWHKYLMAHGGTRHRLFINDEETPYFVDAEINKAHFTYGHRYGLFGSGLGILISRANPPYRIAGCFGGFDRISDAKQHGITLALGADQ